MKKKRERRRDIHGFIRYVKSFEYHTYFTYLGV